MDRTRTRKPTLKSQPSKATREDFKPAVDRAEDSSNRLLHVQLPGFKRKDINVQLDSGGKLLIKGSRQVSDSKYLDVDQSFDVPEDTISEKISWRIEGGRLTLIMPKKVVEEREAAREAAAIQEEKPYAGVEKKEEDDESEDIDEDEDTDEQEAEAFTYEKKDAKTGGLQVGLWIRRIFAWIVTLLFRPSPSKRIRSHAPMPGGAFWSPWKKKEAEAFTEEKKDAKTSEDVKDEHLHEKKHTTAEEEQSVPSRKEKPELEGEKKDDGPAIQEEKKDDDRISKEKKRRDTDQTEMTKSGAMEKEKEEEPIKSTKAKIKDIRRRMSAWTGAGDSQLDSGSLDYILEKLNRNWKVIAFAVVAFSVGLFVSQKLRTARKGDMDTFITINCVISHYKVT